MNCVNCGSTDKVIADATLSVSCESAEDARFLANNRLKLIVCRECGRVDWKVVKDGV